MTSNTAGGLEHNHLQFAGPGHRITITLDERGGWPPTVTAAGVAIDGPGASQPAVSGNSLFEVFNIATDVTASISGLSIIDGNGTFGGGLFNEGTLTLTDSTFAGNSAGIGGAVYRARWWVSCRCRAADGNR